MANDYYTRMLASPPNVPALASDSQTTVKMKPKESLNQMSNIETEVFFTLADLATSNTDEIAAIASRVPTPGIFDVRGMTVKMTQDGEGKDGKPPLIRFQWQMEIIGGKPTDPNMDIEKLLTRKLNESTTLWPADWQEIVGLIKGKYAKVGLPNSGMPMGGLESAEPGWLDSFVGAEFKLKVSTGMRNGEPRPFFDWIKKEAVDLDQQIAD